MRLRRTLVILGALLTLGLTACSPSSIFFGQTRGSSDAFGPFHNKVIRLGINEFINYDGFGTVYRNDGVAWEQPIGFADIFSGGLLKADPQGTPNGPTGPYHRLLFLDTHWYNETWGMKLQANVFGFTFTWHKGTCWEWTHFSMNPLRADSPSLHCTQFASFATIAGKATTIPAPPAETASYNRLTPAQRKVVDGYSARAAAIHIGGDNGVVVTGANNVKGVVR